MCPNCRTPLVVVEYEGVEFDYCAECHGMWFDAGELELVTELAGTPPGHVQRALSSRAGRKGTRRCPRCRRRLHVVTVAGTPSVHVDRCPRGDGLWLDAGELAAIVRGCGGVDDAALGGFFGDLLRYDLTGQAEEC